MTKLTSVSFRQALFASFALSLFVISVNYTYSQEEEPLARVVSSFELAKDYPRLEQLDDNATIVRLKTEQYNRNTENVDTKLISGRVVKSLSSSQSRYDEFLASIFTGRLNSKLQDCADALSKFSWNVEMNAEFVVDEPVLMRVGLKNTSSEEALIREPSANSSFLLLSMKIARIDSPDRPVMLIGNEAENVSKTLTPNGGNVVSDKRVAKPAESVYLCEPVDLLSYYDLSEPGEYELTFYTRRFVDDVKTIASDPVGKFISPCVVRFKIVDGSRSDDNDLRVGHLNDSQFVFENILKNSMKDALEGGDADSVRTCCRQLTNSEILACLNKVKSLLPAKIEDSSTTTKNPPFDSTWFDPSASPLPPADPLAEFSVYSQWRHLYFLRLFPNYPKFSRTEDLTYDLSWALKVEPEYVEGSPISISVGVKNLWSQETTLTPYDIHEGSFLRSIRLRRLDSKESDVYLNFDSFLNYMEFSYRRLNFGEKITLDGNGTAWFWNVDLSQYYDLSKPGEYELTFYTRRFAESTPKTYGEPIDMSTDPYASPYYIVNEQVGSYPLPCTVRFKIVAPEGASESSSEESSEYPFEKAFFTP